MDALKFLSCNGKILFTFASYNIPTNILLSFCIDYRNITIVNSLHGCYFSFWVFWLPCKYSLKIKCAINGINVSITFTLVLQLTVFYANGKTEMLKDDTDKRTVGILKTLHKCVMCFCQFVLWLFVTQSYIYNITYNSL